MSAPLPPRLSPRRADLASFNHGYALAIRIREASGVDQFIVRTNDPVQPVRVTSRRPANDEQILAQVA